MIELYATDFPSLDDIRPYHWAPVLFQPIMASPEQLVVAVVAFSHGEIHLAVANSLDRLNCFYGMHAEWSRIAIDETLSEFHADISVRAEKAVLEPKLLFSGFAIGSIAQGDGHDATHVAEFWLQSISSLHDGNSIFSNAKELIEVDTSLMVERNRVDRLPILVFDFVKDKSPTLQRFFSDEVQKRKARRSRLRAHEMQIDFAGSKLVANFGTLQATQTLASFDLLKRRMWDLRVHKDTREGDVTARAHELYVQYPRRDDPQITKRQSDLIDRAVESLISEADTEEIRLRSFHSVDEIGNRLVELESHI